MKSKWRPLSLKSWHFEASKDIRTKFESQAFHIIRIKYWKASWSGNSLLFVPSEKFPFRSKNEFVHILSNIQRSWLKKTFLVTIELIGNNTYPILFRFLRFLRWEKEETYDWRFELMSSVSEYWILSLHWNVQVNTHNWKYIKTLVKIQYFHIKF